MKNLMTGQLEKINFNDNQNKVIVFLSTQCPCSQSHENLLAQLATQFIDFKFLAIHSNINEDVAQARDHFLHSAIKFSIYQDNNAKLADEFKALKTPHAYIVNAKGEIVYAGGVSNSSRAENASEFPLMKALEQIKSGYKVEPSVNRVLGCLITRP
jgi:hypothetical protein